PEQYTNLENFTAAQRGVIFADICGKRKDDGSIQTFAETLKDNYSSRGKFKDMPESPWPSQKIAQRTLSPEVVDQWGKLYEGIADWLRSDYGVDIEQIRKDIEHDEAATPVDTIIWDVGGVLIPASDPDAVVTDYLSSLGMPDTEIEHVWKE